MAITINGSTGIQMAADDSLEFGTVGISQDTLFSGRKNVIINGDFDVWQRGTSQTTAGYGSADRWKSIINVTTHSVTRQSFTLGQTDVPNEPEYFFRNAVTTGSTAASYAILQQFVEGVRTLAGQTATLSFWAKADSSKDIAVEFAQTFGTGGSPSTPVNAIGVTTCSLTTSWQKFEVTVTFPSISGKTLGSNDDDYFEVNFWFEAGSNWNARTNSLGNQSGTFDIAQVQLEKGSQATAFEKRSYGEELALCQRYYLSLTPTANTTFGALCNWDTLTSYGGVQWPVTMRGVPAVSIPTAGTVYFSGGATTAATAITATNSSTWGTELYVSHSAQGGASCWLRMATGTVITADAEL